MSTCEVAVIGLGAAGSAALYALRRAGVRAVGFDRFAPPHAFGSSHGETRLLRTAYSEGPEYVPLIKRAIALWREVEAHSGARLFEQTGVRYAGPADAPFLASARDAARLGQLALAPEQGLEQWFALEPDWIALSDVAGGYVYPEAAIAAFLDGADVRNDSPVLGIEPDGDGVMVRTARAALHADRVIVTTGAWVGELVPALAPVTFVERRVLHWFADPKARFTRAAGFKPFAITLEDGQFVYGFPANAAGEVKVAEHVTAQVIAAPDALERGVADADIAAIRPLVKRLMPELGDLIRSTVCMYPMAPDERFILARHPDEARIVVGAGLSGHGFKFAPAIGEALANLALGRPQAVDISAFGWPHADRAR